MHTNNTSQKKVRFRSSAPIRPANKALPLLRRTQSAPSVEEKIQAGHQRTITLGQNDTRLTLIPTETQTKAQEAQESPEDQFKREVTEYTENLKETLVKMTDEQKREHLFVLEFTMLSQYVQGRDSKNGETEDQKEERGHRMAPLYGIDPIKHQILSLEEHIKRVAKLSVRFKNDFN